MRHEYSEHVARYVQGLAGCRRTSRAIGRRGDELVKSLLDDAEHLADVITHEADRFKRKQAQARYMEVMGELARARETIALAADGAAEIDGMADGGAQRPMSKSVGSVLLLHRVNAQHV